MSATYENIRPLVSATEPIEGGLRVTFRCPVTGIEVRSDGSFAADPATKPRKRRQMWSLRTAAFRAARAAMSDGEIAAQLEQDRKDGEERRAVVNAFLNVQNRFTWDSQTRRYISFNAAAEVMTEFMQQLNAFPVNGDADRRVCARLLTEIACADGTVAEDERAFLLSFVTPELGELDALAKLPPMTPEELAAASSGARDSLLMLAWSIALTDEWIAPEEHGRLDAIAAGLGIQPQRAAQLQRFAQLYVIDEALAEGAEQTDLPALADRIGLPLDDAERAAARWRKRYGDK